MTAALGYPLFFKMMIKCFSKLVDSCWLKKNIVVKYFIINLRIFVPNMFVIL